MTAFDHILVLLSFVYALALTHVLSRVAALVAARDRMKWSGLLGLAIANTLLNLLINWLALIGFRNQSGWNLLDVAIQLAMAVTLYVLCFLATPEVAEEGVIELEAWFWKQRKAFDLTVLALGGVSFVDNLEYLKTPNTSIALISNIDVLFLVPPTLVGFFVSSRWVQWTVGTILFVSVALLFGATDWQIG